MHNEKQYERERDRQKEIKTDTDQKRDRQKERDRETDRQKERQTDLKKKRQKECKGPFVLSLAFVTAVQSLRLFPTLCNCLEFEILAFF